MKSTAHFRHVRFAASIPFIAGLLAACSAQAQVQEQSDHGSYMINTLEAPGGNVTFKGVIVKLGRNDDAAVCFDTELLRMSAGWVKGSLNGKPVDGRAKGDSFDDPRTPPKADKNAKLGPLPRDWAHWTGLYRHGDQVVLSYTVGTTQVLETPGLVGSGANPAFTRTFHIAAHDAPLTMIVADGKAEAVLADQQTVTIAESQPADGVVAAGIAKAPAGATLINQQGRIVLRLPAKPAAEK